MGGASGCDRRRLLADTSVRVEPSWMDGWIKGCKAGPQVKKPLSVVPSGGFRMSDWVKPPVTHPTSL